MSNDIINNLKKLKHSDVGPDKSWVASNRELLLMQVKNTVQKEKSSFSFGNVWPAMSILMPKRLVYSVVRPMVVLFLIVGVTSSGWVVSADASHNALPGDWLYPAKRAVEKTKIAAASVVGAKKVEATYRVEAAKSRAEEVKEMITNVELNKKDLVAETISDLKNEIVEAEKKLTEIQEDEGQTQMDEMVKDFKVETAGIMIALKDAQTGLLGDNNEDKVLSEVLEVAKDDVKNVDQRVVEVVITKHLGGDKTVTSEEVKDIIGITLQVALDDAEGSKKAVEEDGLAIEEAKGLSADRYGLSTDSQGASQELVEGLEVEVVSSTESGEVIDSSTTTLSVESVDDEKIAKADSDNKEAVEKVDTASNDVTEKVDAVKTLLSVGALEDMVEKMKEVKTAVGVVVDISDESKASVASIVPVKEGEENTTSTEGVEGLSADRQETTSIEDVAKESVEENL